MAHAVPSTSFHEGSNLKSKFSQQLMGLVSSFPQYEDPRSLEMALNHVPVETLTQIATAKQSSCADAGCLDDDSDTTRDLLLLELLRWFKEEFFTWTDKPECPRCSRSTEVTACGIGSPTPEERRKSASLVELYTCACSPVVPPDGVQQTIRFPRYNDPTVLLETRTGRCGEWANCFTLICIAMGFETRYVTDWTDHVWVEVFSFAQNRWLHCDPCENKCDTPLMYELGWGKKLSYIIAISNDDIQDVTWRYSHSNNHAAVRNRRNLVSESWLLETLLRLRKQRQRQCTTLRLQELEERLVKELIEFMTPTKVDVNKDELGGRESGSLAWRLARQEIRADEVSQERDTKTSSPFTWQITPEVVTKFGKILEFFYDSVADEYFLGREKDKLHRRNGWNAALFEVENTARKVEKDWKMVYLAREENNGKEPGKLSWKFEIIDKDNRLLLHYVQLQIPCSTHHSTASILIELVTSTGVRKALPASAFDNGMFKFSFRLKPEVRWFLITCTLSGGEGSISYQQAQLFRESTNQTREDASNSPLYPPFITLTMTEIPDL